mmetsp:Transcript_49032/g.118775  ORF Transcript_49032/g.118775 Transcript_49032/m.118775 type:complete len:83 (+) Transcript_49032:1362-1610(+)
MEIPEHGITTPPANELDCVNIDTGKEEGHSASRAKAASRNVGGGVMEVRQASGGRFENAVQLEGAQGLPSLAGVGGEDGRVR